MHLHSPYLRRARRVGPEDLDARQLLPVLQVAHPADHLVRRVLPRGHPVPRAVADGVVRAERRLRLAVLRVRGGGLGLVARRPAADVASPAVASPFSPAAAGALSHGARASTSGNRCEEGVARCPVAEAHPSRLIVA